MLHKSINYSEYLNQIKSDGLCFGQSWLWMSEVMSGAKGSLIPPDFYKGEVIHNQYRAVTVSTGDATFFLNQKISELKSRAPEKGLQEQRANDYASSVKLVNALPASSSANVAIIMSWGKNKEQSTLNKMLCRYDSAHAMVLLKLKHNGKIYLFDPNEGVYEWVPESGVGLKTDVKRCLLKNTSSVMVAMRSATMLSTKSDISLNFEHVMV